MWLLNRFLKRLITQGELTIVTADGRKRFYGQPGAKPAVTVRFTDAQAPDFVARHPALGAGEAFMDGRMVVDGGDVRDLIDFFRLNAPAEDGPEGLQPPGSLRRLVGTTAARLDRFNRAHRSKRNVAHHYDLSDRLYDLFLDADRQYSCAYFTDPGNSLEQAQADKKGHIAAKLLLKPGQRVLDIGCGWGGMALYLNRVADVDVLGVTLSEEQLKVARRRAEEAGVADRVKFELIDYRSVEGRFDRIVSVGMFEHVGTPQYEAFFAKCRSLLADDGVMLLHTIGRMGPPGTTDAWTTKYIFPGGYNPALSETVAASEHSGLILSDVEVLRLHYAYTIDHWYDRTIAARDKIVELYDERFYRMWTFYLAGAAAAFRHGGLVNFQLQYLRDRHAAPITRDYMLEAERALRAKG